MPDKNQRSGLQKLGDLLVTRVDVLAFLQELLFGQGSCTRLSRHTFGHTPAIVRPNLAAPGAKARVLSFPALNAIPQRRSGPKADVRVL